MKVPLILDIFASEGTQFLKIWYNGVLETIRSPVDPYCYSKYELPSEASITKVQKKLLYDHTYSDLIYKYSFRNVQHMKDSVGEDYFESKFPFKDRIYTDCPDLISKYGNTRPLKIMQLDFEMETFGTFPNSQENAIIAAGLQFDDKPIELILADSYDNDRPLLIKLLKRIEEEDPDLIVTFNGIFFDIPYLLDRLKFNNLNPCRLSRDRSYPYVTDRLVKIGGRILYDLYPRSVERDQNLFKWSPPNRKMKTVAKLYGLDNVVEEPQEIMGNMRAMVGTEELCTYLTSDIRCTKFLCDIYLPSIIGMAETLGISLESCINSSPAYIPNMLLARHFSKMGIISDATVGEAYPFLSENKQGALVGCFKPGLYKRKAPRSKKKGLRKFDVQSYYPNLVRTLNISPETCRIVSIEPNLAPYSAHMAHDLELLTLSIPDEKAKCQIIIEIDFSQRGFTSSFVDMAMNERLELKKIMKTLDPHSPEYADADTNQLNYKVIMNSITGYFGQKYAMYGSLGCYCAITGTGRYLISKLIEHVGNGNGTVALDTDGIVIDSDDDIDETNQWLENYVLDFFGVNKNYIQLEEDHFEAAFFREGAKQYLLLENDKHGDPHLVIHGISFKGSSLPRIYANIIENIGLKMLLVDDNNKKEMKELDDEIAKYYDKDTWKLGLIKKNIKVKPIKQYKSTSPIGAQLAQQYEQRFGAPIKYETQLGYVKVKRKYGSEYQLITIFDKLEDIDGIDYQYYQEIVDSAFKRLDLFDHIPRMKKAGKQSNLFNF